MYELGILSTTENATTFIALQFLVAYCDCATNEAQNILCIHDSMKNIRKRHTYSC